jgi:dihydropteroate synthase/2-amino-4-hydroxy-6-hydroxymethyldihydropteridine diphosphokinase
MYVTDQPVFLNGAVEIETLLSPLELLRELKRVEGGLGRDLSGNALRNGPRPVDLDILLFDGFEVQTEDGAAADTMSDNNVLPWALRMRTDELEIPHPRITEREFVLAPLNDLDSKVVHPVLNKTLSDLLSSLRCKSPKPNEKDADDAARILPLPRGRMLVFNETIIMGILNVTPDSFSDGGKFDSVEVAAKQAMQLERDGAKIIDVGGESTRPGAEEVDVEEEMRRVIPVISRIRKESDVVISVDTRHSIVAKAAIEAGADIVNDVSGGTHDPQMLSSVACMGVPIILMHMRGNPKTMQSLTNYSGEGVVSGVAHGLMQRSAAAEASGVPRWMQVLDPGIGFAKDADGNLALLNGADFLRNSCEDTPLLFGPSRKGFIGKVTGEDDPSERDFGTVAACLAALQSKREDPCNILRVHNVKAMKQAVLVWDAIRSSQNVNEPSS